MMSTNHLAVTTVIVAALCTVGLPTAASAQPDEEIVNGHRAKAREVIIKYRGTPSAELLAAIDGLVITESRKKLSGQEHWKHKSAVLDVPTLLAIAAEHPDLLYVEPNYIITADDKPNDPLFPQQWGLENVGQSVNGKSPGSYGADIGTTAAWDVTTGTTGVVVGVIDSGIDSTHPDLTANLWSAPAKFSLTIGGVTVTCLAGSRGYNAITNTCLPVDDFGHGTHVAGIIGAAGGNAAGVTGVSRTTKMMALKFLDSTGNGTVADAIEAIEFAILVKAKFASTNGANIRVLNASWGSGAYSQALYDQIVKANTNNMLFVAAAGNTGTNIDVVPYYPASYPAPNIVTVGATDNVDLPPSFTNYGTQAVDLSAPGVDIYSTARASAYEFKTGTSQAAAFVAGGAALVLAQCPLDTAGLRGNLLAHATVLPGLTGLTGTGGRLNVDNSVRLCPAPPKTPSGLKAAGGSTQVTLSWNASPGVTSYSVKRSTRATSSYVVIATGVTDATFTAAGLTNGTSYYFKVSATNDYGTSTDSSYVIGTPAAVPNQVIGLKATGQTGQVYLAWSSASGALGYYIKSSTVIGGPYTRIAQTTSRSYYAKGLIKGTKYCFVVAAYNKNYVEGLNSLEVCAIVQ